jgi:hypothetical protein
MDTSRPTDLGQENPCSMSESLHSMSLSLWTYLLRLNHVFNQGSHPSGVSMARYRKNKLSESVRAAGRPGPADPADPTFCT